MDAGLESVVAAHTILSDVRGLEGRLIIRGFELDDLVAGHDYEHVIALLWAGFFDADLNAIHVQKRLGLARVNAFARLSQLPVTDAPTLLRMALCQCRDDESFEAAIDLTATCGVASAMGARLVRGQTFVAPDPNLAHAADILAMVMGTPPSAAQAKALDTYLVTVCEHGLNASTFATRVVASTRAGLASSVIGGLCALMGPLHGGAPGPVLDMLDEIGTPDKAADWIGSAFERGERLMGFGHRIYRARDPRADALKQAVATLDPQSGRLGFASMIEHVALAELAKRYPTRKLETNVEFYTALLLEAVGLPREVFTSIFACGRVSGWVAHAMEQIATKRLIRPMSVYVGEGVQEAA